MKQKILLLFANQYSIDNPDGSKTQGITCNYYFNTELTPAQNSDGSVGQRPAKGNLDPELFGKIKKAPAIYEAEFDMRIGSDGKPVLRIMNLDYLEDVCLVPVSSAGDQKK